ncbi:MAG TPA: sugar phosphate nucleotidyltransferase [Planctomycetota bacterium]|nr:sugar phosphate nucleotidyltransferase [Planctomycetota bacterium]
MRDLYAVVLAGGSGRRLAAVTERLTGRPTPKQYCAFGSRRTLLQETLGRLVPLAPPDRTTVVVLESHLGMAGEQLAPFPETTVLAQPRDCGTGVGLLRALVHVLGRDPRALVLVSPSDHGIRDHPTFERGIAAACAAADLASAVLLGVEADEPRTDYGWIVPGAEVAPGVRRVLAFVEKPGPEQAEDLAARGGLFSTMVLVARVRALLGLFERARPGLVALFEAVEALPPPAREIHLRRAYALGASCDFSRDILAGATDLAVVHWPAGLGWTDLGTPERLARWLGRDAAAPREHTHA